MKRIVWFVTLFAAVLLAAAPADAMPQQAAPITTAGVSPDGCKNFTEQAHYSGAQPYTNPVHYWNYTPYFSDYFPTSPNCNNIMIKNLRINGEPCGKYIAVYGLWYDPAWNVNKQESVTVLPTCTSYYIVIKNGPYDDQGDFLAGRWMITIDDFPASIDATMTVEAGAP
jgi:hypothetical protein